MGATTFIVDLSSYQAAIDVAGLGQQGFGAVIIKATEGSTYVNPGFTKQLAAAQRANMLCAAYHYLHHGNINAQAANTAGVVPKNVPIFIDAEGGSTLADAYAYAAAMRAQGYIIGGIYCGSHPADGYGIWWYAYYGNDPHGYASIVYANMGGNNGAGWNHTPPPAMWQYCQHGVVQGFGGDVDFSAFRGTVADLAATKAFWLPANMTVVVPPITAPVHAPTILETSMFYIQAVDSGAIYVVLPKGDGTYGSVKVTNTSMIHPDRQVVKYPSDAIALSAYPLIPGATLAS